MYYIFSAAAVRVRNRLVSADITTPMQYNDYEPPGWWDAEPLTKPLPTLVFTVDPRLPLLDNYNIGYYQLYSARLIGLIAAAGVRFETFPAKLLNRVTGEEVPADYRIFHLFEKYLAIDESQSETGSAEKRQEYFTLAPDDPHGATLFAEGFSIRRLVMKQEYIENPRPFFRDTKQRQLVFVHQDLKAKFEEEGMLGYSYTRVEDFRTQPFL